MSSPSPTADADAKAAVAGKNPADAAAAPAAPTGVLETLRESAKPLPAFVESCLQTVAGSAVAAERKSRGQPRVRRLIRTLRNKRNILITTHLSPDPDALASSLALTQLLRTALPDAKVSMSIKGKVGGGINAAFARLSQLDLKPWDEATLKDYDAVILLDTQPASSFSPLPKEIEPTAVIDHHRGRLGKPHCPFCDIRVDVGATSSIIFSYFMELEAEISPVLGATLLFAIESDLAGAAGTPGELDNIALSSLTLIADTSRLYQMRYVDLPQNYYAVYASAIANAMYYDNAMISHIDEIDSLEQPAVMGDFLLRFEQVQWALVTAVHENKLIVSLRTRSKTASAADVMRRLMRGWGEGGGHRTKAGGFTVLTSGSATEVTRLRDVLLRRYLRALKIRGSRGQRLLNGAAKAKTGN